MLRSRRAGLMLFVGCCLGFILSSLVFTNTTEKFHQTISSFYASRQRSTQNILKMTNISKPEKKYVTPAHLTPITHERRRSGLDVVFSGNGTKWIAQPAMCSKNTSGFFRATLKTTVGSTAIFVYNPEVDIWVSKSIVRYGSWEGNYINLILALLQKDQDLQFVDIGTNVGVFALAVALFGRRVVAVDALSMNIERLCSSVNEGNFRRQVKMVYNALSDVYETVSLGMDKNNVGGTFVAKDKNANKVRGSKVVGNYGTVQTIKMDDFLTLPDFNFEKVIMKIDVEGYESRVFKGGEVFFKKVDVQAVLMEWMWLKTGNAGQDIINFMLRHNMEPHYPHINPQPLDIKNHAQWPSDVLWRKKPSMKT